MTFEVVTLPDGRMDRRNAALYSGYAPKTLAQWASQGKGPTFVKHGRVWYFKHDLDAWLLEGRSSSTTSLASNTAAGAKQPGSRARGKSTS